MNGISSYQCNVNLGGAGVMIQYAPVSWVDFCPSVPQNLIATYQFTNPVTFVDGRDWLSAECNINSLQFSEDSDDDEQGCTVSQRFRAIIPSDQEEIAVELNKMKHHRFIILYTERGKTTKKLVGSKEYPLQFRFSFDSGRQASETKAHEIEFRGVGLDKAAWYNV